MGRDLGERLELVSGSRGYMKRIEKKLVGLHLGLDDIKKLKIMAFSKGASMSYIIRRLIAKAWAERTQDANEPQGTESH